MLDLLYAYLACGVGHAKAEGAFRALTRGYNHWASGRLAQIQVNTMHSEYYQVRGTCTPMKSGHYRVYILLKRDHEVANIVTASCECAAG